MDTLESLTAQLAAAADLSPAQIAAAIEALTSAEVPDAPKAAFLTALHHKGESAADLAEFARGFRARAVNPHVEAWAPLAVDVVGTGGDHAGGYNVSSMVMLVLAAAGVPAMKHGNRGITSRCGSADLLGGLGISIDASPERAPDALRQLGFVFFFAPAYHPAFRAIAPVRKALAAQGQRTIFNVLGPLLNPGRPEQIVLGVFADAWVPRLAAALEALGTPAGLAVHGRLAADRGIDELTTASENRVVGVGRQRGRDEVWIPETFGLRRCEFDDLKGGDLAANLVLTERLLAGTGPGGLVDTVVWNAATALWICGRVGEVRDGIGLARELLLGGKVKLKLAEARAFYGADPRGNCGSVRQ